MLAVCARHSQNEGIVAKVIVLCAPCRHVGAGVGPADADAAGVCCLPAIGAAAHPVVVVAQRHQTDAILMGQLHSTPHGVPGVQRAKATLAVPAFHRTKAGDALGRGGRVDAALFQVIHHHRKAVQAVAEYACQTVLCKDLGSLVGTLRAEAVFVQHTLKLGQHGFISNSHGGYLLCIKRMNFVFGCLQTITDFAIDCKTSIQDFQLFFNVQNI